MFSVEKCRDLDIGISGSVWRKVGCFLPELLISIVSARTRDGSLYLPHLRRGALESEPTPSYTRLLVPTRKLDPLALGRDEDWEGNNAAFRCPACGKVFIVSAHAHHGTRSCPECGQSTGFVSLQHGRKSGGTASLESRSAPAELIKREDLNSLYQTIVATRNFEINLFWQRANYFLVLNSALAVGFFNLKTNQPPAALTFAGVGAVSSALWFGVCAGGKFWQTRWEQRLQDFERQHYPDLDFFGADIHRARSDVRRGLNFSEHGPLQLLTDNIVLRKPSVSHSMMLLAGAFVVGWILVGYLAT